MSTINQIILKYLQGELSPEEQATLDSWLAADEKNRELLADLTNKTLLAEAFEKIDRIDEEKAWRRITAQRNAGTPTAHRVHFLRTSWFRYAAAVLLLIGTAVYFISRKPATQLARTIFEQPDILPGGNKATLTLADGSTIVLDSAADGSLAQQGNTKIIKVDAGVLAYNAGAEKDGALYYNTIRTPRGGQFKVQLPDGSAVWLNAASSIRFPTVFPDNKREVAITGEAYFEIVKNAKAPFHVTVNDKMQVDVLGTSFNINAYPEEPVQKATLLEGSIRLASWNVVLKPGQQAQVEQTVHVTNNASLEEVMAWKNGFFNFNQADLPSVLRQLARWYDLEVIYAGNMPKLTFKGEMDRGLKLAEVLKILGETGVKFKVEGRKLIVSE